jgi:hypothetical protein
MKVTPPCKRRRAAIRSEACRPFFLHREIEKHIIGDDSHPPPILLAACAEDRTPHQKTLPGFEKQKGRLDKSGRAFS